MNESETKILHEELEVASIGLSASRCLSSPQRFNVIILFNVPHNWTKSVTQRWDFFQLSVTEDSIEYLTLFTVGATDKHFDTITYTLSSQPETTAFTIDPVSK